MLVLSIYNYKKSIYDLKQKFLIILDTSVAFKYECYFISTNGTP